MCSVCRVRGCVGEWFSRHHNFVQRLDASEVHYFVLDTVIVTQKKSNVRKTIHCRKSVF